MRYGMKEYRTRGAFRGLFVKRTKTARFKPN